MAVIFNLYRDGRRLVCLASFSYPSLLPVLHLSRTLKPASTWVLLGLLFVGDDDKDFFVTEDSVGNELACVVNNDDNVL